MRLRLALLASWLMSCQCGNERPTTVTPQLEVTPASIDFGATTAGQSAARTLTLRNPGRVTLTVSKLELSGDAVFSFTPSSVAPIALDGAAELTVTFAPTAVGAHTARLTISSDASNAPELIVSLVGTATLDACANVTCATPPGPCFEATGTCAAGQCTYAAKSDGTGCDDGDACTTGDACAAGVCRGAALGCTTPPGACFQATGTCAGGQCTYAAKNDGTTCDDGDACTTGDACATGVCRGTALGCTTPPAPTCGASGSVVAFDSPGTCAAGACTYPQRTVTCTGGCDGGVCASDPCLGVSCTTPPPCFMGGRCVAGACQYDVATGANCSDGDACTTNDACLANGSCAGTALACATPPAPTCVDAVTQRTSNAAGTCAAGQCTYATADVSCALGCDVTSGLCRTTCPAGQHVCTNACVSDSSVATCGASCTPCPAPANGSATCTGGVCGVSCDVGYGACGAACCRLPLTLQAYVKASNTGAQDNFGFTTALSADGNTLVVGAPFEDGTATDGGSEDSGAVYVFVRSGSAWTQQAILRASNAGAYDLFGLALTISADGNTVAVGASEERSSATGVNGNQNNDAAPYSGAVYVFVRAGTTWSQQAYVKASNTGADDRFGNAVALSGDGNTLAVGAYFEASAGTGINGGGQGDNSAFIAGAAYVFTRTGSTWTQQAYLKASNTGPSDWYGSSVALSFDGNTLAVGEMGDDSGTTSPFDSSLMTAGSVFVYARTGTAWAQQAYLKASTPKFAAWFGSAVSLAADGNTLAVAANEDNSNATGVNGSQADTSAGQAGAVYVFTRAGTAWSQQAYLKASNTSASDQFGTAVALSADGATLVCTAWQEDSDATTVDGDQLNERALNSGAAYVFTRAGSTWSQLAYVKAPNAEAGDRFGMSAAVSADGGTLVFSARDEDSNAIGLNGDQGNNDAGQSGAVYVFTR